MDDSVKRMEHMKRLMNDPEYRQQVKEAGSAFTSKVGPDKFVVKEAADKLADAKVNKFNFPDRLKKFGKAGGKLGALAAVGMNMLSGEDASASVIDAATPMGMEVDSLGAEKGSIDDMIESGKMTVDDYLKQKARLEAIKGLK